jgi:small subunit ribosomal protein S1
MSENAVPFEGAQTPLEEDEVRTPEPESIAEEGLRAMPEAEVTEPQAVEQEQAVAVEAEEPAELASMAEAAEAAEPAAPVEEETVEAAFGKEEPVSQEAEMQDVFSDEFTYSRPKRGEIRTGTVIEVSGDGILIDLGLKREGLIPGYDLQRVGADAVDSVSEGDELPVYVVRPEHNQEGHVIVSWYRARQEQDWVDAQKLQESGDIWEGEVRGYNRGGLIVPFGKIRGFVPASHVTGIRRRMGQAGLQTRLAEMVGDKLPLKVLEVNRPKRRLIFSERTARRQWRALQREKLLSELQEGAHVHGVVSNVCDFGAFVDIGGTDGLVHISELSWRRTSHPSEVVSVGDEVDAYVLRVDRERKRIGLSLRLMEPDPWETVDERYSVGQLVTGLVTKLTDFGAFAALDDGIEGLIHISELAEVPPRHPSEVVTAGTALPLIVVKIDSRRRRMGLSLKRVSEEEWFEWEEERRAQAEPEEAEAEGEAEEGVPETAAAEEAEAVEEAQLEPELQPELAEEPEAAMLEPAAELQELAAVAESGSFEPPDEVLIDEPPPEEMQEPPPLLETTPPEPPVEIPVEAPPPEEEGLN